jgi:hypothetical protein
MNGIRISNPSFVLLICNPFINANVDSPASRLRREHQKFMMAFESKIYDGDYASKIYDAVCIQIYDGV